MNNLKNVHCVPHSINFRDVMGTFNTVRKLLTLISVLKNNFINFKLNFMTAFILV